jgi:hypothetical protein
LSQRHDHRGNAARWRGCAGIFFLLLTMMPGLAVAAEAANSVPNAAVPDPNADQILLLDVHVNGHSIGKIGEFTLRHGILMARMNCATSVFEFPPRSPRHPALWSLCPTCPDWPGLSIRKTWSC